MQQLDALAARIRASGEVREEDFVELLEHLFRMRQALLPFAEIAHMVGADAIDPMYPFTTWTLRRADLLAAEVAYDHPTQAFSRQVPA